MTADVQLASKSTKFIHGSEGIGNAENQIGFSNRMQEGITKKTKVKAVKKKPCKKPNSVYHFKFCDTITVKNTKSS